MPFEAVVVDVVVAIARFVDVSVDEENLLKDLDRVDRSGLKDASVTARRAVRTANVLKDEEKLVFTLFVSLLSFEDMERLLGLTWEAFILISRRVWGCFKLDLNASTRMRGELTINDNCLL